MQYGTNTNFYTYRFILLIECLAGVVLELQNNVCTVQLCRMELYRLVLSGIQTHNVVCTSEPRALMFNFIWLGKMYPTHLDGEAEDLYAHPAHIRRCHLPYQLGKLVSVLVDLLHCQCACMRQTESKPLYPACFMCFQRLLSIFYTWVILTVWLSVKCHYIRSQLAESRQTHNISYQELIANVPPMFAKPLPWFLRRIYPKTAHRQLQASHGQSWLWPGEEIEQEVKD